MQQRHLSILIKEMEIEKSIQFECIVILFISLCINLKLNNEYLAGEMPQLHHGFRQVNNLVASLRDMCQFLIKNNY